MEPVPTRPGWQRHLVFHGVGRRVRAPCTRFLLVNTDEARAAQSWGTAVQTWLRGSKSERCLRQVQSAHPDFFRWSFSTCHRWMETSISTSRRTFVACAPFSAELPEDSRDTASPPHTDPSPNAAARAPSAKAGSVRPVTCISGRNSDFRDSGFSGGEASLCFPSLDQCVSSAVTAACQMGTRQVGECPQHTALHSDLMSLKLECFSTRMPRHLGSNAWMQETILCLEKLLTSLQSLPTTPN